MEYPEYRPRRMRRNEALRSLIREHSLSAQDFIVPLFLMEGKGATEEIPSMPGYFRYSVDTVVSFVKRAYSLGLRHFLCFAKVEEAQKDNEGTEALNEQGLMQRGLRSLRKAFPDIVLYSDVALDPYSSFGHDGIVEDGEIRNDETIEILAQIAVSHAKAGADIVAPSDMMDGRIGEIRAELDAEDFHQVGILAYSAKYASSFYGPFRDALDSAPGFGDKKTYQMDPSNILEAIREVELDISEGADIIMVKPGMPYLDVLREIYKETNIPLSVYQVSGEYSMIKAAAAQGWIDERSAVEESLIAFKRAGANAIVSYFAVQYLEDKTQTHDK